MEGVEKPRVITLGAGTGQRMVLKALRKLPVQITAVANVTDNGGHTGYLRKQLDIPATGDVRQCLSALAIDRFVLANLLDFRFGEAELKGMQMGNLILASLINQKGSLSAAVREINRELLPNDHNAWPVSDDSGQLGVELTDGTRITGEWQVIERENKSPIASIFHDPPLKMLEMLKNELEQADQIVVCPGNLHTAVLSCLRTEGLADCLSDPDVPVYYVCNLMSFPPLTEGYTAADHLSWIERIMNSHVDVLLLNRGGELPDRVMDPISGKEARPVRAGDLPDRVRVVEDEFAIRAESLEGEQNERAGKEKFQATPHTFRHNPSRLRKHFRELFDLPEVMIQ